MTEAIYLEVAEKAEAARKAKRRVSVSGMLKILGVSRAGYNAWLKHVPSNAEKRREAVKAKIKDIYDESKQNYGAPKITQVLRKAGEIISERTVGQYMKQMGIKAQWVKPWTITTKDSDFSNELQNILDEQFNPERPNTVWCSDITYKLSSLPVYYSFSSHFLQLQSFHCCQLSRQSLHFVQYPYLQTFFSDYSFVLDFPLRTTLHS